MIPQTKFCPRAAGLPRESCSTFREPLPISTTNLTPDYSPPGAGETRIVLASNTGLIVQSTDGTESWQLTTNPYDTTPTWSPDGKVLAVLTDRRGEWEIWAKAADGSGQGSLFGTELAGLTLDYAFANERALDWAE